MLSPRRESHMIEKMSSYNGSRSAIRRDWSQLPAPSTQGAIRVIHIFAPKVIKTDVANFRALVQKLTGKSKRGSSGDKRRAGASGSLRTTSSMRSLTSSSDATFSSSADTTAEQSCSTAAETCSDSSTRSSNSDKSAPFFSSPDSSTTSSEAATANKYFGLPSSFSSSQALDQMVPAEISAAFFRSQACTTASSTSSSSTNSTNSCKQSFSSVVVDPLQSLSGYKDNWSSLQASSCSSSFNFSNSTRLHDQNLGTASEQQQNQNQAHEPGPYSMSTLNVNAFNGLAFSDIDILTGLVSPGPLPEYSLPPPLMINNNNISCNTSIPSITSENKLLSNHHHQPNVNCRLSVQSLLRGSVSAFEHC